MKVNQEMCLVTGVKMQRLLKIKLIKAHVCYRKQFDTDTDKEYCIKELSIHGFATIRGDFISNVKPESSPSSTQSSPKTEGNDNNDKKAREKARQITI